MIRTVAAILATCLLSSLAAMAASFDVITDLEVKEPSGIGRANWPATTGVPLPEGALKETGDAVLLDADGKAVPAQFEVLSRWIPGDGSIRWLLVDTQADLKPSELATLSLAKGGGRSGPRSLRVDESDDAVTITTGPLRFRIDRNEGSRLFSAAWLDVSGDGRFDSSAQIIEPAAEAGASIREASSGQWHRSGNAPPKSVSIETRGSLRVVARVDGTHVTAGGGADRECYDYTCRVHAYAGQPFVKVQYTVKNLRFDVPFRAWAITDGSLTTTLNLSAHRIFSFGHGEDSTIGELSRGVASALTQFDPGSYRIAVGERELCFGKTTRGWADLSDQRWGVTVGVLDFALQYPKTMEVKDNRLTAHFLSPRDGKTSFIEIGCTKTHDLIYHFHSGPVDQDKAGDLLTAFQEPVHLLPPTAWVSKSRAWAMDLCVPDEPRTYERSEPQPYDVERFGGWDRFGGYWEKGGLNAGGYHSNMDTVMGRYVQTGDYAVFRCWAPRGRAMVEYTPWSPEGFHFQPGTIVHMKKAKGGFPLIPINTLTGKTAFTPEEYERYRFFVARDRHWPYYKEEEYVTPCDGYVEGRFRRPDSGHFGHYIPKDRGGTGFPYFWEPGNPTAWHGKGQLHPRRLIPFAFGYRVTGRADIYDLGADLASYDNDPYHGSYQSW